MRVITVTCDSCDKESFVKEDDFALFCPFCGSRSDIYYKPEIWELKSKKILGDIGGIENEKGTERI